MKVGNYEFEIKNFKYLEARSEETNCFSAVLYVNGKKAADCGNSGHGGPTAIYFFPSCEQMEREIKDFLKTQPKIKYERYEFDLTLEYIVDGLVEECLDAKFLKKWMKKAGKYLLFRNPQGTYYQISWKKYTVDALLKTQPGRDTIQNTIAIHINKDNVLLNENIPSDLLPDKKQ